MAFALHSNRGAYAALRHLGRVKAIRAVENNKVATPGIERVIFVTEFRAVCSQAFSRRRIADVTVPRREIDGNVLIEKPGNPHQSGLLLVVIGILHKVARHHDECGLQSVGSRDRLLLQCRFREGAVAWRLRTYLEQSKLRIA